MDTRTRIQNLHFFTDSHGNVVIGQWPNVPLYGWLAATVLSFAMQQTALKADFSALGTAFLFTWAYLELFQGVNYFRRLLGLVVLIAIIIRFFIR